MATGELKVARYRVRRWTAYEWTETEAESRKDREQHLERMAALVQHRMIDMFPRFDPHCVGARVEGVPQLVFDLTVDATGEQDAVKRAIYRCERALSAKLPQGMGRREALRPPWGRVEVEEAQERRLHAVG